MQWLKSYVGIPYLERGRDREGIDCFGLYRLVVLERTGVDIGDPFVSVFAAIRRRPSSLAKTFRRVDDPQEGDAVLINRRGYPIHVGYRIDATRMLHADEPVGSVVERYTGIKWKNRVEGFYRHEAF